MALPRRGDAVPEPSPVPGGQRLNAGARPVDFALVVTDPAPLRGRSVAVGDRPLIIGRTSTCHVCCNATEVSRTHCAIVARGRKAFIHDLGSTSGTFVNGGRVGREQEVRPGDRIRIGRVEFELRPCPTDQQPASALTLLAGREAADDEAANILLAPDPGAAGPDAATSAKGGGSDRAPGGTRDGHGGSGQFCPRCGKEGEWVPPTRLVGSRLASIYCCPEGHTWQAFCH